MAIDWGNGTTNIDLKTGVRYGVLANLDANIFLDEGWTDITFKGVVDEAVGFIMDYLDDGDNANKAELSDMLQTILGFKGEEKIEEIWDAYMDSDTLKDDVEVAVIDYMSDWEDDGNHDWIYDRDGYAIESGEIYLMVFKSPWVTRAEFCSLCYPGAGNLSVDEGDNDCWAYALGPEWFDEYTPMPYKVVAVEKIGSVDLDEWYPEEEE